MKRIKKIWPSLLTITSLIILTFGLIKTSTFQSKVPLIKIDIDIDSTLKFVTKFDVSTTIRNKGFIKDKTIEQINLREIETSFLNNPYIEDAQVSKTLNGNLNIKITQRTPIARVFTSPNKSYYIDDKGLPMPTSKQFTQRVLVVTGYTQNLVIHNASLITQAGLEKNKKNNDLYLNLLSLLKRVKSDSFWNAQISQIELNKDKTITMTTLAGNQQILFGHITQVDDKLDKLMILYKDGFSNTGWESYSTIDLRFDNQIVCKKNNI